MSQFMQSGAGQTVTGGVEVGAGILTGNPMMVIAGIGSVLSGIGTLLHGRHGHGTASRHPIAPWNIVYGRAKVGGTVVYLAEFDNNDKYLDMVFVLAAHVCQSVDYLLFNGQRLTMDPTSGTSYTPVQQTVNISHISRANNVVTVILEANIPTLIAGDPIMIQNISGDYTLNGTFPVEQIISQIPAPPTGGPGSLTFTYLCGGMPAIVDLEGQAQTVWVDYQRHVHMEVLLGNQTSTFWGMLYGTPNQGDMTDLIQTPTANAWTADCLLQGKTCVFLRLNYDDTYFAGGVPIISFLIHGKNDIVDPRLAATVPSAPGAPSVEPWTLIGGVATQEPTGSSTFAYVIVASVAPSLVVSVAGSTAQSDSTLSSDNYIAIVWTPVPEATSYTVYRTACPSGYSIGRITSTTLNYANDNGMAGDGTSPPAPSGGAAGNVIYSENVALCIADYLTDTTWGFKAVWGTEVPTPQLIAAANICDELVELAEGGTEPRYSCNGQFPLTTKRGEVLQNLLTACAGRITYCEGQFVIWPAAWPGVSFLLGPPTGIPVPIVSAVLSVMSSFTQGEGYTGIAYFSIGTQGMEDGNPAGWAMRTDTISLTDTADILAVQNAGITAQFSIGNSLYGSASTAALLLIYDSWLTVTFADGTIETWDGSWATGIAGSPGLGEILNPPNAIDSDPTTYATVEIPAGTSFGFGGYATAALQIGGYAPATEPVSPPDSSPSDVLSTGQALSQAAGPFKWRPTVSIRDLFNGCKGTYICPSNKWQPSDIPPYAQDTDHGYASGGGSPFVLYPFGDANLYADGGDRRWLDIQLPFTISASMAQRLCKIELMRRRQQGTGTFSYNMALYQATALDVFQMTLPMLGWYNKLLEISAFRFKLDKVDKVTLLGTEIDVQETDPSVYDWSVTEELTPEGYQQAALPSNVGTLDDLYTVNGQ
jgi:hypothetical protein